MQIQMIKTGNIFGHPQNPRTDNGDLTELTDSIRTMGILQNLTVVPYDPATHTGVTVPADGGDYYIAVAGNRRLAAAKKAKLTEVPAIISNMDYKTQLKVMLIENLQRETLTPYQQAKTIQMMMDMGDTVADIAQQTGFSEATVRNRVKLSVFDPNEMAKVENRNATMKDYLDLAKVEDDQLRNEALKEIGTANFRQKLAQVKSTMRDRKNKEDQLAVVKSFATETTAANVPTLLRIGTIYPSEAADKIKIPADKDTIPYFYIPMGYSIELYRKKTTADDDAANARQKLKDDIKGNLIGVKEASARAAQLRLDFLAQVSGSKMHAHFGELVAAFTAHVMALSAKGYTPIPINAKILHEMAGIALVDENKVDVESLIAAAKNQSEWVMSAFACAALDNGDYFKEEWVVDGINAYAAMHKPNSALDSLYNVLIAMGYPMSDEEKQLQDGTYPKFYVKPAKKK